MEARLSTQSLPPPAPCMYRQSLASVIDNRWNLGSIVRKKIVKHHVNTRPACAILLLPTTPMEEQQVYKTIE